jgi:GNAT superfamily N-acetyltransferase
MRHPEHDAVSQEVRRWYNSSFPEIGLEGTAHWFGFTCRTGTDQARIVLSIGDPAQVPDALAAGRTACPARGHTILVDDRDRAARLDPALRAHGCHYEEATTFLALPGPLLSPAAGPENLDVTTITPADLETWARVKLQAFAGSEDPPSPAALDAEITARHEEQSLSEYQLARLDGQPVAVLAHYPGPDDLVFILGTRAPYRHRGIAQALLARWAATATAPRSLMINALDRGAPAALYRRLGFTDEVYWYGKYELSA